MLQIERDFLRAIQMKNDALVFYCLSKGVTPNTSDDDGVTALEYAVKYNPNLMEKLAQHPKTTKKTFVKAIKTLQMQHRYNEDIKALKEWNKETPFFKKIIDTIIAKALALSIKAALANRSIYIKQQILYKEYQKERS